MKPGEILCKRDFIDLNAGLESKTLTAVNQGSRPIQVGSHFHFFEANRFLRFDREAAYGFRPDIASGAAIRFEPGERKEVRLVRIGGRRVVRGLNNLTDDQVSDATLGRSLSKAKLAGFAAEGETK
ncbi:MAG: urease subunit beta [Candidatus Accumulibacter sp.]|jgi:urease beta subunit|nr:urease subunit beta [Accumulibacter sp.]